MTDSGDNPSPDSRSRRLPTRAEVATMAGMLLAIGSLFLPWERVSAPVEIAIVRNLHKAPSMLTGFQMPAHWWLTVCGIVCGLSLLWAPVGSKRLPLLFTQGLCGLICLMIPLSQLRESGFTPLAGVFVALIGGGLLLFGALDRFYGPSQANSN